MELIPSDLNLDILGKRRIAFGLSGALIALSILAVVAITGIRLGIDFTGGVELQVQFEQPVPIDDLRATYRDAGQDVSVQAFGDRVDVEYLVRAPLVTEADTKAHATELSRIVESKWADHGAKVVRVEVVGPKVGSELRRQGLMAILFALVGILAYVWIRFEMRYAFGAIVALVHDVMITIGFFSLTQHEFNLPTIAAVLTIIGYSLNDTVVVFDRIRENRNRNRRGDLAPVINRSINETLSRTILTSLTTLFTVAALLVLTQPGSVIHDFALALLVGIIVGTYSSIFVASPVLLVREGRAG
ncbi:MAG: protein translocase subunit SecF [Candidatus Dadabacteria bacterium]|nr:MAG: protein translocase subunit SecF [Candidatus Dadabacteria bacterium]